MDHRRTETFYAITTPGLEPVCAAELNALELPPDAIEKGGIAFHGQLRDLYRANLWLRTASRSWCDLPRCPAGTSPTSTEKHAGCHGVVLLNLKRLFLFERPVASPDWCIPNASQTLLKRPSTKPWGVGTLRKANSDKLFTPGS